MKEQGAASAAPNLKFAHIGLAATDVPRLTRFYTEVLGFTVTDRGDFGGAEVVFMSRDPEEHHQIVLTPGRPKKLPKNTVNPDFGICIQQISFKMGSLDDLRDMVGRLERGGATDIVSATHGNAWSVYAQDPDGNMIEFYVDTDWYASQPFYEPLDLSKSNDELMKETQNLCEVHSGFQPAKEWRRNMTKMMPPPFRKG
jgi:catechol-2,3-dioxygenase